MTADSTWLVTGANGFLGVNAGFFLNPLVTPIGAVRSISSSSAFADVISFDITDHLATARALEELRPTVVLNTAAVASHELCEQDPALARKVNTDAVRNLAHVCVDIGARFIQISTDAVFDGVTGNYAETDDATPFSVYGQTKLEGEVAALDVNPDSLIIRTNFFGWSPTGTRSILEFFVNSLSDGKSVNGYSDYVVSSIYAQDLLQTIWDLNSLNASGIFHCVASDSSSKFDFGLAIARAWALDSELIHASTSPHDRNGISRVRDLSLAIGKAAQALGRELPTQAQGLQHAYADRDQLRNLILRANDSSNSS